MPAARACATVGVRLELVISLPLKGRPELNLYAAVVLDAAQLVHGGRFARRWGSKANDVAAARRWIKAGDVGVVSFNDACGYLGCDAAELRRAILSTAPAA